MLVVRVLCFVLLINYHIDGKLVIPGLMKRVQIFKEVRDLTKSLSHFLPQMQIPDSGQGVICRGHTISKGTMRRVVVDEFPFSDMTEGSIVQWKGEVQSLAADAFTQDTEWWGWRHVKEANPNIVVEYSSNNSVYHESTLKILEQFEYQMDVNRIEDLTVNLMKHIYSAPSNIRPAYRLTDEFIGDMVNPPLKEKPTDLEIIKPLELTTMGQLFDQRYGGCKKYTDGGIASSDQPLKPGV